MCKLARIHCHWYLCQSMQQYKKIMSLFDPLHAVQLEVGEQLSDAMRSVSPACMNDNEL